MRCEVLRCPGHGLEFSLSSGQCRGAQGYCLKRYRIDYDGPWIGVSDL